jgi:quinol monooxygenase YgiN
MTFVQSIVFASERRDEVLELLERWSADATGNGTAVRGTLVEDRSSPGRFRMLVWFDSAEAAAENSDRSETGAFAQEFGALCSEGPEFQDLDVIASFGS